MRGSRRRRSWRARRAPQRESRKGAEGLDLGGSSALYSTWDVARAQQTLTSR